MSHAREYGFRHFRHILEVVELPSNTRSSALLSLPTSASGVDSAKMFRLPIRRMATAARQSLKIGLIPADGIGKEVIPAAQRVLEAIGSDIPKPEFVPLLAGWETFVRSGHALPDETVE